MTKRTNAKRTARHESVRQTSRRKGGANLAARKRAKAGLAGLLDQYLNKKEPTA